MTTIQNINPTFLEYEGYTYLEFEGQYYKGCKRCGGVGHYAHNGEHDRCYACDNTSAKLGESFASEAEAQKWCHGKAVAQARRDRIRQDKLDAAAAKMVANQEALKAEAADVYEFLMGITIESDDQNQYSTYEEWAAAQNNIKVEGNGFIRAMAETLRWVAPSKRFTPRMIEATRSAMAKRVAKAVEQAAHPAPAGRVVVTGEITSTKTVENDFGTAFKILVKDDSGYKVWVSLPKAQADEAYNEFLSAHPEPYTYGSSVWFEGSSNESGLTGVKGRRITFTATLEPSKDDVAFAFGSRPTKGAWL